MPPLLPKPLPIGNPDRRSSRPVGTSRNGFVRYDLHILVALIFIVLAVVIPRLFKEGWKSAALALLIVLGFILGVIGLLLLVVWLHDNVGRAGMGWRDKVFRGIGHLLRFSLSGFVGLIVAAAIVAQHKPGPFLEDIITYSFGALCGFAGVFLHQRLGKDRFWPAFGKLGFTLVGSLFGGILGILGPEPWAVDAGILAPILVFLILVAMGRIVPRRNADPEQPGS